MPKSKTRKNQNEKVQKRNKKVSERNRAIESSTKLMSEIDAQAQMEALHDILLEQHADHESGKAVIQDKEYLSNLTEFVNLINSRKKESSVEI